MTNFNAFILAAGRGERLGPITSHLPKPLLPILGRPIIELIISKLSLLNFERFGVNTHYEGDLIGAYLTSLPLARDILLFPEESVLGTGGALSNAASLLRKGPFITHNADILSDLDIRRLIDYHVDSGRLVTLAVHDYPQYNNVWIDREGHLLGIGQAPQGPRATASRCVAFTGVAAYSPGFLDYLPSGYSHVTDAWIAAAAARQVGSLDFTGSPWTDIGSPAAYADAVFSSLRNAGEAIYIHESAACGDARLAAGSVLEEGVVISGTPQMKNCIVMPGTHITDNAAILNKIVGPSYSISLDLKPHNPRGLTPDTLLNTIPGIRGPYTHEEIGTGGSDRRYYRIHPAIGRSVVLMESPPADADYQRHIHLSRFFIKHGWPVAELLAADESLPPAKTTRDAYAALEDLGDLSLYSWLKCRRDDTETERLYKQVLDTAAHLHTDISRHAAECPELASRSFDYDHLRWETTYFMEHFVTRLRNIPVQDPALDTEFHRLASRVASFPQVIVHRDFQSQNIMIADDDTPRVIDFQGARLGPPAYDIASLLWDPYAPLSRSLRERLLDHYQQSVRQLISSFDVDAFLRSLLPCRLQRHMQALGAYSFLSLSKGKPHFKKFIHPCLLHLVEEADAARQDFPRLHSLVLRLHETS